MTLSKAKQAERAAARRAPVVPDAPVVADTPREAKSGEFFVAADATEEARLDDLHRQARAAQTAPSQWPT